MKTRTAIITVGMAVALIGATTLKLMSNKASVAENVYRPDPTKRVLVKASEAKTLDVGRSSSYTGSFAAWREVMLVPQVSGEVTGIFFEEGDYVTKGKKLVQFDDELLRTQYVAAEASYQTARKSLGRNEIAAESGGISSLQLDNLRLNVKEAESRMKQLDKQIRLSRMEAPFAGTITYRNVEPGSLASREAVARLSDIAQLKLEVAVPEGDILQFKQGQRAEVRTEFYPGKFLEGRIVYVSDRADNAHNYLVRIQVRNERSTPLKAGMYGTAQISMGSTKAIFIPRVALLGSAKNPQVFVVRDRQARLTGVRVGIAQGDLIEITRGLEAGDRVVISGHINLADGSPVEIAK